ncbi:MAG: amino acid ABC transporter ATP-binding protein [Planctomycetota bacterium]|nr:amino acid ABC transporter ATP-binding protein [Planctomycetales bacterium]RLT07528.1 MAG: amino acid ABC transporter ATP-binding protein [Planctomycetota bacterium]
MIVLTNLVKRYQQHEVLRGVSLTVADGEVCVLLGPSGGGKSTLLRTINGLESFDSGSIRVNDIVLNAAVGPERDAALLLIRKRVGMVFQQFNLFPHRSVLENVTEAPIHVLKQSREAAVLNARRILARVGMADKEHARPGSLSGGQQQRVAIARTLAMNPEAILFDEPTSALDPRTTADVISVMTDLAASGQRMIVVTHAMSFARTVAHQVHILHAGRIAESGPPEQIFEDPQQAITREFLSEAARA